MRKRSYVWWNVAGILVFVAGFFVGSIDMAARAESMSDGGKAMVIAAVLQIVGGGVAVVAFILEKRRRVRVRRQSRRLGTL